MEVIVVSRDRYRADAVERTGFSLVEVLVVCAILALLVALLMPSLSKARMQSKMVRVHSDLRQITVCLDAYMLNNRDKLPPARCACGTFVNHQLPVELATQRYLPKWPSKIPQADFEDFFNPGFTYKFVAPGAIYYNGSLFDAPKDKTKLRARIYVPDDFPKCAGDTGRWYHDYADEPESPIRYAVWSMGPDPKAAKFPRVPELDEVDDWQFPARRKYWMLNSSDVGLLAHMKAKNGGLFTSP